MCLIVNVAMSTVGAAVSNHCKLMNNVGGNLMLSSELVILQNVVLVQCVGASVLPLSQNTCIG